jgi:hypothetical protein
MIADHRTTHCTVSCDTDGCSAQIYTNRDITEEQAAAAAMALGWDCERRRDRWHHRCAKHKAP